MLGVQQETGAATRSDLDLVLDRPLPEALPVRSATAVFCVGTCFHRHQSVVDLEVIVDGVRHRPTARRMPRLDRFRELHPTLSPGEAASVASDPQSARDPELRSYRSGFWATVPIRAGERLRELELTVEARLADGTAASAPLGTIAVVDRPAPIDIEPLGARNGPPLIAICMATYNPDIELLRVQVESIRAQTDTDWVCVISDDRSEPENFDRIVEVVGADERFLLSRAGEHLGFYRNFERVLSLVPPECELVALSDHDDRWYPDKLEALREAIVSAELAFSDLRRVDADGRVRAMSLWRGRRNNLSNLASLLISNTFPGAACLFRRRVIDRALPFPTGPGWDFHDHWLALVAMSLGEVAYVDRPLYDYVQHPGAVLGRAASSREPAASGKSGRLRAWLERRRGFFSRWREAYFSLYLERDLHARVLLARCEPDLNARKRRALRLMVGAVRSPLAFAWLAARPARALIGRNETLGAEDELVRGILWRHLIAIRTGRRERPGRQASDASLRSAFPRRLGSRQRRWLAGD
jgi:glycosyltransferase involved in cell wall biosynthesis